MENQLIIGFLSGSLGTLLIKEVINQINKKIDFNRDLTKYVYQKKIEAAEKAMSFYSTYTNIIAEINESFKVIKKSIEEDADVDMDIIQEVITTNSGHLKSLFEKSYSEMNTVNLYFDLTDSKNWKEEDVQELYSNLAEVKMQDTELLTLSNLLTHHHERGEQELVDYYDDQIEETLKVYLVKLDRLINSFAKNKLAIDASMIKLKSEIKKKTGL